MDVSLGMKELTTFQPPARELTFYLPFSRKYYIGNKKGEYIKLKMKDKPYIKGFNGTIFAMKADSAFLYEASGGSILRTGCDHRVRSLVQIYMASSPIGNEAYSNCKLRRLEKAMGEWIMTSTVWIIRFHSIIIYQ